MSNNNLEYLTIISCTKLNQKEIDLLIKSLPFSINKGTKVKNLVDPSLLAGVVIRYRSKVIDLSLKKRLVDLREQLISSLQEASNGQNR